MMKRRLFAAFLPPVHRRVFFVCVFFFFFGLVHFKKLQSSCRAEMRTQIKMSAPEFVLAGYLQRWDDNHILY